MLADAVLILAAIALAGLVVWWEVFCLTELAQADRVRFLPGDLRNAANSSIPKSAGG
jgi:hypothetical protein